MKCSRAIIFSAVWILLLAQASPAAGESGPSLAVIVYDGPGSGPDLTGKLQPLLDAEASQQWPGQLVERALIDKILAERQIAAAGSGAQDDSSQMGKMIQADYLLTVKTASNCVSSTLVSFPNGTIVYEQTYRERLEPYSLALRIVTDACRKYQASHRDAKRPSVSMGAFYYADPHRRFFEINDSVRGQLRRLLAGRKDLVLTERMFPSVLLEEHELARGGLTADIAVNLSAPPADILLYGEFAPQPEQALGETNAVLDFQLTLLSPTSLCQKRSVKFSCRSHEPEIVVQQASKLIIAAAVEAGENLAKGKDRVFSEDEFNIFKQYAFKLMPTPPMDGGVFYQSGHYRGAAQTGKPEELERALRMLECAMLFKGDDTQVLVCSGVLLIGLSKTMKIPDDMRHKLQNNQIENSNAMRQKLLNAAFDLIERAYRLESNPNTRGALEFCVYSGGTINGKPPSRSLDVARYILSTRHQEAWKSSEIQNATTTFFFNCADMKEQENLFLELAPEYEDNESGRNFLYNLFSVFGGRSAYADRLIAQDSLFLQVLGHYQYLRIYEVIDRENGEEPVQVEFATHFRKLTDELLPALIKKDSNRFGYYSPATWLCGYFKLYDKAIKCHKLDDDVCDKAEQYFNMLVQAQYDKTINAREFFNTLFPILRDKKDYSRACRMLTALLVDYGRGQGGDYEQMWLARQRNWFGFAMLGVTPASTNQLEKIRFDDNIPGFVTKAVSASDGTLFGIRRSEIDRNGISRKGWVFHLNPGTMQAEILKNLPESAYDVACAGNYAAMGTETNGLYLLNLAVSEIRNFNPQNSALPGLGAMYICDKEDNFLVAVLDKNVQQAYVYLVDPVAGKISNQEFNFFPSNGGNGG